MSLWALYFGWPGGEVWPNLVASAITGALAAAGTVFVVLRRGAARLEAHHQEHVAELAAHRTAIGADVARQLAKHHGDILRAVGATGGPVDPGKLYFVGEPGPEPTIPPDEPEREPGC